VFHKHRKHQRSEPIPWIKIAATGRGHGWHRIVITMSPNVVAHLGLKHAGQVEWAGGSGSDAGWLELRRSTNGEGYTLTRRSKTNHTLMFAFAANALGVLSTHTTEKITATDLAVLLADDAGVPVVRFELPRWAGGPGKDSE